MPEVSPPLPDARWRRVARALLPDTLFGRLALVLVVGTLASQLMTSSIWMGVRQAQTLETPTRLVAERMADALVAMQHASDPARALAQLSYPRFVARIDPRAERAGARPGELAEDVQDLARRVIRARLPDAGEVQVTRLRLLGPEGREAPWAGLLGLSALTVDYGLQMPLPSGGWLRVDAQLSPGWQEESGWQVLADLLWRVYALRALVVVALVLLAVRWVVRPLQRMARAAQALEQDVGSAPVMSEAGPREVRQAAQAFNRMQRRIAAHLQERTRFLAAVSHDLRTPITRMRLRLELLDGRAPQATQAKLRADLADMEGLIDSTLAYIQAGEPHGATQQIDLDSLVRSLCQDRQDLGQPVTVEGRIAHPVEGYGLSLRRACENLVDNALRYGGGSVTVVLGSDGRYARVAVQDEGPGIPAALIERVRQPFERGEGSRSAHTGGHGLGLSIVEAIVQTHGGALHLRNRTPRGFEACMELPHAPAPMDASAGVEPAGR